MRKSLLIKQEIAKLSEGQMLVICSSVGNPDHGQYAPLSDPEAFIATSFEQASAACKAYIGMWDLGGGNWTGGQVYDPLGKRVGLVSYNGSVWNNEYGSADRKEFVLNKGSFEAFLAHYKGEYDAMMDRYFGKTV